MSNIENQILETQNSAPIHWGHFSLILGSIVVLAVFSYIQKPELFSLKNSTEVQEQNVPKYYAYVAEEVPTPLVAGASTNQGPSVINEDGSIVPVDMGQVLGASTENVVLQLDDIKVKTIPDSEEAVKKYLDDLKNITVGPIDDEGFESALSSGNQNLINEQAKKLSLIKDQVTVLPVPKSLEKYAKLTILQYNSAVTLLQNFTKADENPELVGQNLQTFLKSQQDLDTENSFIAKKYSLVDPYQISTNLEKDNAAK